MKTVLHWLRDESISDWLRQNNHLLSGADAFLVSETALEALPASAPTRRLIFARKRDIDGLKTTVPNYVVIKSDEKWVELVLSFQQQITW
jgi:sulfur transfer complex TusBCD TusB component (DsrH family)